MLSIVGETIAKPTDNNQRLMLRQQLDQDKAASYVFRSDNHGPPMVYYLTADDLNRNYYHPPPTPRVYHHTSPPYKYSSSYAAGYPRSYSVPRSTSGGFTPYPVNIHLDDHSIKADLDDHSIQADLDDHSVKADLNDRSSDSSSSSEESNESGHADSRSHDSHNDSKDHSAEGGKSAEEKYHKKNGKKSSKGYNNQFKFSKGKKGSYDNEHDSGDHKEDGGHKSSKYDEADNYKEHDEESHKKKGGHFGSKKNHKKGSKSKGYHNVFMKDEYKKDHTFYGENKRSNVSTHELVI